MIIFRSSVICALLTSCVVAHDLRSHVEWYRNGRLKIRYHYYVGADGRQIKDGKLERWDDRHLIGVEEVYKDGKLVSSTRIVRNQ